jgi:Mrp family chromosome partitioning ATPase
MRENEAGLSVEWLPGRLRELRLEFDYTILHGPPAALCSDATLLGYLSDGVVLVLEANSTRRAAAQRAVQMLQAANAKLLGSVLSKRTFPIPERIYRNL